MIQIRITYLERQDSLWAGANQFNMATSTGGYPKLENMGSDLMEQFPAGVRAYLFLEISDSLPLREVWRSGSPDKGIGGDGKRVLGACMKRERSVLIHDAESDPQMQGIRFRSFMSAIGVPIFDDMKSLVGALFFASDEVGTFNNEHKFAVERMGRDYVTILSALRKLSPDRQAPEPNKEVGLFSPAALVSAGFGLMLLLIWLIGPSQGSVTLKEPEKPIFATAGNVALDVSNDFLNSLRKEQYDKAWQMLDSSVQSTWPVDKFTAEASSWYQSGDHKQILEQRFANRLQKKHSLAQVVLEASSVEGDREDWVWELAPRGDRWVIVSLSGPFRLP
jgi:hypothetical protein